MTNQEARTVNYIKENWEVSDRLAVVLINRENRTVTQRIKTAGEITAQRYQAHLRAANASGADVFISMNALKDDAAGRTKEDIKIVRHVFLDIDSGGSEKIRAILKDETVPAPHHILESSPDKFQVIWSVKEFSLGGSEILMRGMAVKFGADPAATDSARVLRLPGFRNCKYETPHYVKDAAHITGPDYTPAAFPQFSEQQIRSIASARAVNAGTGTQSHKDFAWTMQQLERKRDPAEVARELEAMRQDKPNPRYYASRTVHNAMERM